MLQVDQFQPLVSTTRSPVLVAIPAYNEDRFIASLVIKLIAAGYPVVVVDDGSSDQTASVAEAAGARVVRHAENRGKAAAIRTAFTHALQQPVEALVLIDGDSQHEPAQVADVVAPVLAGEADMVVGSRFLRTRNRIPRWRVAGQHALTLATNLGSGLSVSDSQSGFRAFSRRALQVIRFRGDGFSVESEMQFHAKSLGLVVTEVPIHVHYELPIKRSPIRQGLNVLDGLLRLVAQHRPLLFFGVPGLTLMLAAIVLGFYTIRIYEDTLTLAIGYALITVMLSIIGILAVFVGMMLHAIRALLGEMAHQVQQPSR